MIPCLNVNTATNASLYEVSMKKVVTIQDISCYGKCSLTVALPIISAMGVETSVIPTAVLSTHTGGFKNYTFRDLTEDISPIAEHWKSLGLKFDAVYTGYLGSLEQINLMSEFFDMFRTDDNYIIVDPVLGDKGVLYPRFDKSFISRMKNLCGKADIILPNMTETSFMLDTPYSETVSEDFVRECLIRLTELGCDTAVITGVQYDEKHHGAAAYQRSTDTFASSFRNHIKAYVHGTGDVFSSAFSGAVAKGASLQKSLDIAVNFTADCIEATLPIPENYMNGVYFEKCLGKLAEISSEI